ncbi:hypothetical protein N7475_009792 [Penicillium sp. IBT 31633x]|nr:hypothetical protein N7475_009792 [Penicillium sp. IBT 31633x]
MIAVICFAWAMQQHHEGLVSTDGLGEAFAVINLGTAAYGFVWSTVVLIVVFCNCAIPPGVIIAFDCIAFLAQIITVGFELHELTYWHLGGYEIYDSQESDRLYGAECLACAVMVLGTLFNLILCVRASMACHGQRKASKRTAKQRAFDA